jgi:hypothetical protein
MLLIHFAIYRWCRAVRVEPVARHQRRTMTRWINTMARTPTSRPRPFRFQSARVRGTLGRHTSEPGTDFSSKLHRRPVGRPRELSRGLSDGTTANVGTGSTLPLGEWDVILVAHNLEHLIDPLDYLGNLNTTPVSEGWLLARGEMRHHVDLSGDPTIGHI